MKHEKTLVRSETIHKNMNSVVLDAFLNSSISEQIECAISAGNTLYYNDDYSDIKVYVVNDEHTIMNEFYISKNSITLE